MASRKSLSVTSVISVARGKHIRRMFMLRRMLVLTLMIASMVITPLRFSADEGMWLPDSLDKLPLSKLKSRGLQLTPEDIYEQLSC